VLDVPSGRQRTGPFRELGIVSRETVAAITSRQTVGLHDKRFGYPLDRDRGVVVDSKQYGPAASWFGTRSSSRAFGHTGAWSSVGFADPEYQLVVALGFNGMMGTASARHDARVLKVLDALYDDLRLGIR
jgi:CubicO group peptidase (beta-lactamase class C family)